MYVIDSLQYNCLVDWVKSLLWLDSALLFGSLGLRCLGLKGLETLELKSEGCKVLDVQGDVGVTGGR